MKIAIIDYGLGNLHSAAKALVRIGADARITSDPEEVRTADKVVLPGVGAFGDCMNSLTDTGLVPVIHEVIQRGIPFLGICVGMQLMFEGSEEDPEIRGIGIFKGIVRKIQAPGLKIPHMGWNSLRLLSPSPLFKDLPQLPYVYFVHSYHAKPMESSVVTAVTDYGEEVTAAVGVGPVQGVQFHPEKSSALGLTILKNFKEMSS